MPTPASVTPLSFIPAPVSFGGMPSHRYWEMESRQIEFADIDAHTTDVAKLLLTEFALVYGNDWCVIPYELPVGSLSEVVGMLVSDDFGEQSLLLPAGRGLDDRWQRWSMFTMSRSPAGGPADTRFLVPPAVAKLIEGAAAREGASSCATRWRTWRGRSSASCRPQLGVGISGYTVAARAAGLVPAPPPLGADDGAGALRARHGRARTTGFRSFRCMSRAATGRFSCSGRRCRRRQASPAHPTPASSACRGRTTSTRRRFRDRGSW